MIKNVESCSPEQEEPDVEIAEVKGNVDKKNSDSVSSKINSFDSQPSGERYLSPLAAAAIIASWNTTSTLINFPHIYGILGTIGGILFTILIQGGGYLMTKHIIELVRFYSSTTGSRLASFTELGERLFGKAGRTLFTIVQMSNQIGFLPYALVLMVNSLQNLFPDAQILQCNVQACTFVILFCYLLVQVSRDWKDFHWLAYITWFLATVQGLLLVYFALANTDITYGAKPTPVFVGMNFDCDSEDCLPSDEQYSFLNITSALSGIVFSFAPCFIIVELMSEMKTPDRDANKALTMAFSFSTILYMIMGLVFCYAWGNQVPMAVHSVLPQLSWESILANIIILVSMVMDFVISVLVINRFVVGRFRPDFDYLWTMKNAVTWGVVTFVPVTCTFLLTLFIPNLEQIIGFVDAFSIPWAQFVLPALFSLPYFLRKNRGTDQSGNMIEQPESFSQRRNVMLLVAVVFGTCFSLLKTGVFIYDLTLLNFTGNFWCEQVAAI